MITQLGSKISLILDKSAFQAFSFREINLLHKYFWINVTPILVMEILGDLKKGAEDDKSEKKVTEFAHKLHAFESSINGYYLELIESELLGVTIPFYQSVVDTAQPVKMSNGQIGFRIHPSDERYAIDRWQNGDFLEIERVLSQAWRKNTSEPRLLIEMKERIEANTSSSIKFTKQQDILAAVDAYIEINKSDSDVLRLFIEQFSIPSEKAGKILYRWETTENKNIKKFAPYTLFCLRANLLFQFCLQYNLIGTRPTNLLDMQYVYYLPFCRVFLSNDLFHDAIVPYLINKNQMYIKGADIKADLKNILSMEEHLAGKELRLFHKEPPDNPKSLIFQIWKSMHVDWTPGEEYIASEEELKRASDFISRLRQAKPIA